MQIPLPKVIPKFTVFRFFAKLIINLIGIWGYYTLFIGITLIFCSKYIYKAYKVKHYDTVILIILLMFILIGGIIALINN